MKTPTAYKRLLKPIAGVASYTSLWQGPDHLLLATSNGYTETYHRIHYEDVVAVLVRPSKLRLAWNGIWGGLAALCVLFSLLVLDPAGKTALLIAAGACSLFLLVNTLCGPTCKAYLATRVQTTRLPLRRRRQADRLLRELGPVIAGSQSTLPPAGEPFAVPLPTLPI